MANTALSKLSAKVILDDGTDSQGNSKYVNINFPNIAENRYDADKLLSIVDNLEMVLNKTVARVEETRVNVITAAA